MHQRVQQGMPREAASRQNPGDDDRQRQAEPDSLRRDIQRQPDGFPFFRGERQVNAP